MAYAFSQKLPGVTKETYERILAGVGSDVPEGLIVHVAGPCEGGYRVIDVWESEEQFDKFRRERLGPALEKAGIDTSGPRPQLDEVHSEHVMMP